MCATEREWLQRLSRSVMHCIALQSNTFTFSDIMYTNVCSVNLAFGVSLFSEITGSSKFTCMSNISIQQTLSAA